MRDRKAPYRPRTDNKRASEVYNDGIVRIYAVEDRAAPGLLPKETLIEKGHFCYQERKLGIKRYYEAKQNQIHAERVIRIQRSGLEITNQDAAVTEDGRRYRIDLIQEVRDVWPESVDLTLTAYTQRAGDNVLREEDEEGGEANER